MLQLYNLIIRLFSDFFPTIIFINQCFLYVEFCYFNHIFFAYWKVLNTLFFNFKVYFQSILIFFKKWKNYCCIDEKLRSLLFIKLSIFFCLSCLLNSFSLDIFIKIKCFVSNQNFILDVQPQALKSICKLLQITLPRYADRKSTKIVDNFVRFLLRAQPSSIPYLIKTISDVAETYKNVQST